jgi:hypothetical protein
VSIGGRSDRGFAAGLVLGLCGFSCAVEAPNRDGLPVEAISDALALRARVSACLGVDAGAAVSFFGPELVSGVSDTAIRCLEPAADCDAVLACLGLERNSCTGTDACRDSTSLHCARLSNGVLAVVSQDCADDPDGNQRCSVLDDGKSNASICNAGPCRGERCDGDVRIQCWAGAETREDCGSFGRICVSGPTGVFCARPGSCDHDQCIGNTAVSCRDGHVDVHQDCGELVEDGVCRVIGNSAECVAKTWHPSCPPNEPFVSFCDGRRALACYLGALYEARCDAFLHGDCEPGARGIGARCRVPAWP